MESLAAIVSGIYFTLIGLGVAAVVVAVLYRNSKLRPWPFFAVVGLNAAATVFAISASWALAMPPLIGMAIAALLAFWPKKKRAE